jgi:hypothetical protein
VLIEEPEELLDGSEPDGSGDAADGRDEYPEPSGPAAEAQ